MKDQYDYLRHADGEIIPCRNVFEVGRGSFSVGPFERANIIANASLMSNLFACACSCGVLLLGTC